MCDAKYIKSVNFKCDVCMTLNISHLMVVLNPNSGVGSGIGYDKIGVWFCWLELGTELVVLCERWTTLSIKGVW